MENMVRTKQDIMNALYENRLRLKELGVRNIGLSFFLEEILRHRVEILTVESLSPYLGPYILKEVEYATLSA